MPFSDLHYGDLDGMLKTAFGACVESGTSCFDCYSIRSTVRPAKHRHFLSLTRITTKILVEIVDSKPADEFFIAIEPRFAEHLSFVSFMKEGVEEEYYPITELKMYITAHLEKAVAPKATAKFVIYEVYRGLLQPYPKEIVEEHLKTMKLCSDSFSLNDDSRIYFVHACFTLVEKTALWFFFSS